MRIRRLCIQRQSRMRIALNSTPTYININNVQSNRQYKKQTYNRKNPNFGASDIELAINLAQFTVFAVFISAIIVACVRGGRKK